MPSVGDRVQEEVLSVKSACSVGRKTEDRFYLGRHDMTGLCGSTITS
jgi:hypothetical protein